MQGLIHELQVHQIELEMQAEELREAQLQLLESRDKYLDLYEFAPIGYITLNDKGLIEEANLTSASLLKTERNKILRSRFSMAIADQDADQWYLYFAKVLNQKGKHSCSLSLKRGDGSEFLARLESIQIMEMGHRGTMVRVAISDISDLKKVADELRESEERYHSLVDSANEVIVVEQEGMIRFVNRAAATLTGFLKEELLSTPFLRFVHAEDRAVATEPYVVNSGDGPCPVRRVLRIRTKDGVTKWVKMNTIPFSWQGQNATLHFITDITETENAETELKRSNSELQQFAYVASHDLKEPLRMVISYLTLLEKKYPEMLDPEAREFIGIAVDGGKRMSQLIEDLLRYSRVDTTVKALGQVDMNHVVAITLSNLGVIIEESNAEISIDPLPTVVADESQMVQLMQNLISNAIKFRGPERPRIRISATIQSGEWTFSVKDNGIGLGMEYKDRIFLMFQRLHSNQEYPGTGVGLAIAKKIIDRHGGSIWVESKEGEGATFFFSIPAKCKAD